MPCSLYTMAANSINGTVPPSTQNGHETMDEIDDKIAKIEVKEPKKMDIRSPNVSQETETTKTSRNNQQPQKVIYKGDSKTAPSPTINLGVWGKIPIHTLNDMYLDTADGCMLTLSEAKLSRSIGGWVSPCG